MRYLLLLLLALPNLSHALTVTISNAGGNWSANGTWTGGTPPTASDDVVATATSGQVTVDTTTCVAKTVDFTGYTNTFTLTAAKILNVSGNFKTVAGMSIGGTGLIRLDTGGTITSGGLTWPALTLNSASTWTLGDNCRVSGAFINAGTIDVVNGNQLRLDGNMTFTQVMTGTTNVLFGGTGTWTGTNDLRNNLTINTAGTLTCATTQVSHSTGTLTYVAGTVVTTNSTLLSSSGLAMNLDTAGIIWNNFSPPGASVTLLSPLTMTGTLGGRNTGAAQPRFIGNFNVTCGKLSAGENVNFIFPSGVTLTVTTTIVMGGTENALFGATTVVGLKAFTASSPMFLNFTGYSSGLKILEANFTDVNAVGSSCPILNYFGGNPYGGITRCTNIYNRNLPALRGCGDQ